MNACEARGGYKKRGGGGGGVAVRFRPDPKAGGGGGGGGVCAVRFRPDPNAGGGGGGVLSVLGPIQKRGGGGCCLPFDDLYLGLCARA